MMSEHRLIKPLRRDPRREWIDRNRLHADHVALDFGHSQGSSRGPSGLLRKQPHAIATIGPNGIKRIDRLAIRNGTHSLSGFGLSGFSPSHHSPSRHTRRSEAALAAAHSQIEELSQLLEYGVAWAHQDMPNPELNFLKKCYVEGSIKVLVAPFELCWSLQGGNRIQADLVIIQDP